MYRAHQFAERGFVTALGVIAEQFHAVVLTHFTGKKPLPPEIRQSFFGFISLPPGGHRIRFRPQVNPV